MEGFEEKEQQQLALLPLGSACLVNCLLSRALRGHEPGASEEASAAIHRPGEPRRSPLRRLSQVPGTDVMACEYFRRYLALYGCTRALKKRGNLLSRATCSCV